MRYPWQLKFWDSGEWQVCKERLRDLEIANGRWNPGGILALTSPLRNLAPQDVKVVIIGQDPYPDPRYATGTAFSIPASFPSGEYPITLRQIFMEYAKDLRYPTPTSGDLSKWTNQGVLLWNAIPTCEAGKSLSHDWDEYSYLTKEIIQRLAERPTVFCLLGSVARRYLESIPVDTCPTICTSHPSPRDRCTRLPGFTRGKDFIRLNPISSVGNTLFINPSREIQFASLFSLRFKTVLAKSTPGKRKRNNG